MFCCFDTGRLKSLSLKHRCMGIRTNAFADELNHFIQFIMHDGLLSG